MNINFQLKTGQIVIAARIHIAEISFQIRYIIFHLLNLKVMLLNKKSDGFKI